MPDDPLEITARQKALELNRKLRTGAPVTAPTGLQSGVETFLKDPKSEWKFSDSGAGGAILVKPSDPNAIGTAIKIEHVAMIKNAEKCGQVMEGFFSRATGPAPFAAPRVKVYGKSEFEKDTTLGKQLSEKLDELSKTVSNDRKDNVQDQIKNLQSVSQGDRAVAVMEFAKGTQINNLPPDEKVALFKSEGFAQAIGRSIAPSIAVGLADHLGLDDSNFQINISNLMYHPDSGTLSVIDYDGRVNPVGDDDNVVRVGAGGSDKAISDLHEMLKESVKSPANYDSMIDALVKGDPDTPLTPLMKAFTTNGYDNLFRKNEKGEIAQLTVEDKRRFAENLLKGAVEGLEYVQKNQVALKESVESTHETVGDQKIEHFYTKEEMQKFITEISKVDANTLKTQMQNQMDRAQQKRVGDLKGYVADVKNKEQDLTRKISDLDKKIDHLKREPTMGEKAKAALSRKGHKPVDKLVAERGKLQGQLDFAKDMSSTIQGQVDYYESMAKQSNLKPNIVAPQKVSAPTNREQLAKRITAKVMLMKGGIGQKTLLANDKVVEQLKTPIKKLRETNPELQKTPPKPGENKQATVVKVKNI